MNLEKLRAQLEIDEGVKYEIYNDHLGYPTFGVGHLVLKLIQNTTIQLELLLASLESSKHLNKIVIMFY